MSDEEIWACNICERQHARIFYENEKYLKDGEHCRYPHCKGILKKISGSLKRGEKKYNIEPQEFTDYERSLKEIYNPAHYNVGKYEVIDVIEDWELNFRLGNTIKYIARAEHKGNSVTDLKKARWYLEREISIREKQCVSDS